VRRVLPTVFGQVRVGFHHVPRGSGHCFPDLAVSVSQDRFSPLEGPSIHSVLLCSEDSHGPCFLGVVSVPEEKGVVRPGIVGLFVSGYCLQGFCLGGFRRDFLVVVCE